MLILLAPSEEKVSEINSKSLSLNDIDNLKITFNEIIKNLSFHYEEQYQLTEAYFTALLKEPEELFKTKQIEKILNSHNFNLMPAIERYCGVAFKALAYNQMNANMQSIANERIIIFSNLFGALLAKDLIPFYKVKQGARLTSDRSLNQINQFCKLHQSNLIDKYAQKNNVDFIIDLRAKFYEDFYLSNLKLIKFKILKHNKLMSHFSKYYRGLIAHACVEFMASSQAKTSSSITKLKHLLAMLENCFKIDCIFDETNLEITMNFED